MHTWPDLVGPSLVRTGRAHPAWRRGGRCAGLSKGEGVQVWLKVVEMGFAGVGFQKLKNR